jgi:hypothetical protein
MPYRHRSVHTCYIALFNEQLAGLEAQLFDIALGDRPTTPQLLNLLVEIGHDAPLRPPAPLLLRRGEMCEWKHGRLRRVLW